MIMHGTMMDCLGPFGAWGAGWPLLGLWLVARIAIWALVITGLVFAVRWLRREASARAGRTPLEILKARYARGEISRPDFETMKQDLERA